MKALILAAGYGVRLYPFTKEHPKALLKVGNKPIIDYIIDKLNKLKDIDEIIIVTNSKFISQFRKWRKKLRFKKKISLVDDLTSSNSDRRGAIGDIDFAIDKKNINDDLLVIGSDNLFKDDLSKFLLFAKTNNKKPIIGIYDIKNRIEAKKYGVLKLDRKNRIIDFKEKPRYPKSTKVAMCLYYFPKEKIRLIKEYLKMKGAKADAVGFYIDWLRKKEAVYGFEFTGQWYDIGDYKFYNEAKKKFRQ